ncbi:MAG TPA: hypothetical protein VJL29_11855 [Thermoguttaceae bacterium]|nr:hypothetical protein [Thermoguttaceae bacterium]
MSKDQNTFAKRARETEKKRKAEAKRSRRRDRKSQAGQVDPAADAAGFDTDPIVQDDVPR